jgi:phenylalanyl-tRNA synthetase beta chain
MSDDVAADRLERALRQAAAALLVDVNLFDTYRGRGVPEGHRSLAWRLRLQARDRNLTDADVADVKSACEAAAAKLGAELRS